MSLANSGQACVSQSRLLAPRQRMAEIGERLRIAFAQWPLGDPKDAPTRLGPLATQAQQARVCAMIERASAQGARLLAGGGEAPAGLKRGFYIQPTVFGEVRENMEIAREEVFGSVLALMAFDSEAEATALANASAYGLSGAVWSRDVSRATAFTRSMKTGQVVNNGAAQT